MTLFAFQGDTTQDSSFNPAIASSPQAKGGNESSFNPQQASTPKKNIRFMDERYDTENCNEFE